MIPVNREELSVLVVGLGNREITPDALGPRVADNMMITRHVIREFGKYALGAEHSNLISSIVPGVMAQTGMESLEIIRGVIRETEPDCIVAVDALAARSVKRLNRTIQITNTGINPGSGVGNHRHGLNRESVGIPVIADRSSDRGRCGYHCQRCHQRLLRRSGLHPELLFCNAKRY